MSLSIYNSTNLPLQNGDEFLGAFYDNILDFSQINISISCDVGFDITYYFSQDKLTVNYETTQTITATPNTTFLKVSPLERYFKLGITASDGNMAYLNLQTIYKNSVIYSQGGVGADVNVTNAEIPVSQSGDWDVSSTSIYNLLNTKGTKTMANGVIASGASTDSLNLSNIKASNISMYGTQNTNGNVLTVQYSNNGTVWYDTQYNYTFGTTYSGEFGFNLSGCSAKYIRAKVSDGCTLVLYCDYS